VWDTNLPENETSRFEESVTKRLVTHWFAHCHSRQVWHRCLGTGLDSKIVGDTVAGAEGQSAPASPQHKATIKPQTLLEECALPVGLCALYGMIFGRSRFARQPLVASNRACYERDGASHCHGLQ